jgi:hypothetical protein
MGIGLAIVVFLLELTVAKYRNKRIAKMTTTSSAAGSDVTQQLAVEEPTQVDAAIEMTTNTSISNTVTSIEVTIVVVIENIIKPKDLQQKQTDTTVNTIKTKVNSNSNDEIEDEQMSDIISQQTIEENSNDVVKNDNIIKVASLMIENQISSISHENNYRIKPIREKELEVIDLE